jgi:ABC-2 type transport system permease protein
LTRAFLSGVRVHFLLLSRSSFDLAVIFVWPLIFATIAYYLYGVHADPKLLASASLGASMMAIWSSVVIGASGALELQRWSGTLELLIAAPVPAFVALAPITTATSIVGVYSLGATLIWGRLAFGIPIHYTHPFLFLVSLLVTLIALGMLGLVVASTFVLYRAAVFLGFALQNPVYLATGLLVPLALLPAWVTPISWLLAPTWAMRALRGAAIGGGNIGHDIALCVITGVAYLAISLATLRVFETLARRRATLPLA